MFSGSFKTNVSFKYSPTYSFIFPFEDAFQAQVIRQWFRDNWYLVIYFCVFYLAFVFGGRVVMKSRPKYDLRAPLVAWNAFLAIFSIMGALRTLPEFGHAITRHGFHFSTCNRSYADFDKVSGFWGWMFVMSKVPEFIDTAFIVLRKQELIFLHWYHHLATALVLWFGYSDHSSLARWTIVMNYSVHGIMYSYFALRAARVHVPRWIAMLITTSQIAQMFIGIFVTLYVQMTLWRGERCDVGYHVLYSTMLLYASYLVLFVNFFVKAYFLRPKKIAEKPVVVANGKLHDVKSNGYANGYSNGVNGHATNGGAAVIHRDDNGSCSSSKKES